MNLTAAELSYIRSQGLYITEKCPCGKVLNQTIRFTVTGKPEVYCSAVCRDTAFFGDLHQAKKQSTPGKCAYCGGSLKGKRRGALFCDEICKKRFARRTGHSFTAEVQLSGTLTQPNQRVADAKNAGQGNCITDAPQRIESTLGNFSGKFGAPVGLEKQI